MYPKRTKWKVKLSFTTTLVTSFIHLLSKELTQHFIHSITFNPRSFFVHFIQYWSLDAGSFQLKYITLLQCPASGGLSGIAPSLTDLWSFRSLSYTFRFDSAGLGSLTLVFGMQISKEFYWYFFLFFFSFVEVV